jgi:hypothetical protein
MLFDKFSFYADTIMCISSILLVVRKWWLHTREIFFFITKKISDLRQFFNFLHTISK